MTKTHAGSTFHSRPAEPYLLRGAVRDILRQRSAVLRGCRCVNGVDGDGDGDGRSGTLDLKSRPPTCTAATATAVRNGGTTNRRNRTSTSTSTSCCNETEGRRRDVCAEPTGIASLAPPLALRRRPRRGSRRRVSSGGRAGGLCHWRRLRGERYSPVSCMVSSRTGKPPGRGDPSGTRFFAARRVERAAGSLRAGRCAGLLSTVEGGRSVSCALG